MPEGNLISSGRFLVNTPQGCELVVFFQMYLIIQHTLMNVLIEMISGRENSRHWPIELGLGFLHKSLP